MLLSFNICSISAWTALSYARISQYSRVNARGQNWNLSPQLRAELHCMSPIVDRFVCIQYHMILSSDCAGSQASAICGWFEQGLWGTIN